MNRNDFVSFLHPDDEMECGAGHRLQATSSGSQCAELGRGCKYLTPLSHDLVAKKCGHEMYIARLKIFKLCLVNRTISKIIQLIVKQGYNKSVMLGGCGKCC